MTQLKTAAGRDYGVDLLRIVAIMMVVVLHILTGGGLRTAAEGYSHSTAIIWLLTAATTCAVNVYGLVSGYVGCYAQHKISNYLYLWCQTVFYSVGIACCFGFQEGYGELWKAFTPVMSNAYWYFTSYTALFFLMPALNHLICTFPRRQLLMLGAACIFIFSCLPFAAAWDLFKVRDGYSFLWLMILYLLGGICRRLELFQKVTAWQALGVYLLCCFVNLVGRDLFLRWDMLTQMNLLFGYTAPLIVVEALALLALFAGRKLPGFVVWTVRKLSPLAFGVYLIHVHPMLYPRLLRGQWAYLANVPCVKLIVVMGLLYLGIYLSCTAIEAVRAWLFSLLRVRELCNWAGGKMSALLDKCFQQG